MSNTTVTQARQSTDYVGINHKIYLHGKRSLHMSEQRARQYADSYCPVPANPNEERRHKELLAAMQQGQGDPPATKRSKPGPKAKDIDGDKITNDDWKRFHETMKLKQKANPDGKQKTTVQLMMDFCNDHPEVGTVADLGKLIDRVRKRP